MSPERDSAQLEWEERAGRPAATAAFAAGLLPLIGGLIEASSRGTSDDTAGLLAELDDAVAPAVAGSVVSALGILLLPVALGYLYRAVRTRREQAPPFALPLLAACALGAAVLTVVQEVLLLDVAGDFVAGDDQSEQVADDLLEGSALQTTGLIQAVLRLGLGVAIVLIALNAMRAGLLGRFMGILGIGVGAFYAIPLLVNPVLIQLFWAVALGFLFLGRWPGGGRGPAWERVEAIPWPTTADRVAAERGERGEQAQREAGEAPEPRPASRKRRRTGR